MATTDLHATTAARLGAVQQRYTPKRRALVDLLADAGQPLAIPDILTRGASLAQSSVYRNLVVLEQAGVVRRVVSTDDYARYELAEDLTEHHHHLICSGCGEVSDFVVASAVERRLDEVVADIGAEAGYRIEGHRFDVIGTCTECSETLA